MTLLLSATFLAGCRSTTVVHINPYLSFHDELFPEYQQVDIESETKVFEIKQVAKTFVDQ